MNGTTPNDNKHLTDKRYKTSIRRLSIIVKQKINDRSEVFLSKLQYISISKSPQLIALKFQQLRRRLSRLITLKLRLYWTTLFANISSLSAQQKQKAIDSTRTKDRIYEAKVKALRVLSRQWKEKQSKSQYKNKYFTPKTQQTPKMVKEKVCVEFYTVLRNVVRGKYLGVWNVLRTTQTIRTSISRTVFLANYLVSKRRYWLTYGLEKVKVRAVMNKEQKNNEEIEKLDTKLAPIQDPQMLNLKEKQQKLQSALDTVNKEKQEVLQEVEKQMGEIEQSLEGKNNEIKQLEENKEKLLFSIEQCREETAGYTFTREQMFYFIYTNFLKNLKLWSDMSQQLGDEEDIFLNKSLLLQWLQCPVIDFNLDTLPSSMLSLPSPSQSTSTLLSLIQRYQSLQSTLPPLDLNTTFQSFFSSCSLNHSSNTFEEFSTKVKFTHKFVPQLVKENQEIMESLLGNVEGSFGRLQAEGLEVLEDYE